MKDARVKENNRRNGHKENGQDNHHEWKTPRGGDIREVTRDATGQVLDRYSEALKKLKDT